MKSIVNRQIPQLVWAAGRASTIRLGRLFSMNPERHSLSPLHFGTRDQARAVFVCL
jgi:hypothetical protein